MPGRAVPVQFALTEEQDVLRRTARRLLEDRAPLQRTREVMEGAQGYAPDVWSDMAAAGWLGVAVEERYGGAGCGFTELSLLIEEMGRVLLPSPFLSTAVLSPALLGELGTEAQRREHVPSVVAGRRRVAVAVLEPSDRWAAEAIQTTAVRDGAGWVLDGVKAPVLDGAAADLVLVAARTPSGVSLFLVPAGADGLGVEPLSMLDLTRPQARITLDGVRLDADALLGAEGDAWPAVEHALDLAGVALACDAVGGAQRALELSLDHATTRYQFGRPIASFQAVKHRLADMLVAVESAKSAAYYAARVAEDRAELRIAAPVAKVKATEVFLEVATAMIQIHGGIGFPWEHDAHLFLKRAKTATLLFGSNRWWRARLGDRLGL